MVRSHVDIKENAPGSLVYFFGQKLEFDVWVDKQCGYILCTACPHEWKPYIDTEDCH